MCASSVCKVALEGTPREPLRGWDQSGSPSDTAGCMEEGLEVGFSQSWSLPCTPCPSPVAGPAVSVLVPHLCQVSVVSHTLERQMALFIQRLFSFLWKKNVKTLVIITTIIYYVLSALQMLPTENHSDSMN